MVEVKRQNAMGKRGAPLLEARVNHVIHCGNVYLTAPW